jgi:hypothetical protein
MGPEPRVVWLVRPGSPEAARGRLSVERHALTFSGEGEEEDPLPIPMNRISRVRRRRGAPILEVEYTDARAELFRVYMFFVEPPPLPRRERTWVLPTRGMERAASAVGLRAAAKILRAEIDEWVEAIRGVAG